MTHLDLYIGTAKPSLKEYYLLKKNKEINIIKLKDIDPMQAAYIHTTLGSHPKKRPADFVETFIKHKMEKGKNVIQKK